MAWESGRGSWLGIFLPGLVALHEALPLGSAHTHRKEKQAGVEVQLHALLCLAQLGAPEEGCVHLEKAAFLS